MSSSGGKGYQLPWYVLYSRRVEKYRPRRLEDVVGNAPTVDRLRVIEENGNCPHLLVSVRRRPHSAGTAGYRQDHKCTLPGPVSSW